MKTNRIEYGITSVLLAFIPAAGALAGGGNVLPAVQNVDGYSLATAAQATAVYNTGVQAANPATPAAPTLPFNLLVPDGNDTLQASQYTYLPVFNDDNSGGSDPNFPSSITNQTADAAYLDNYVQTNYGVTAFLVQVDGQTTQLDDSYITGVNTSPLLDGTPGGNAYISSSVFLSPLSPGDHTIGIGGLIGGQPTVFVSYDVDVVPEPASLSVLGISACSLLARHEPAG